MRILATLVLLLSSGMFVSTTSVANAADRPPGVDADHWVVLGESIGIVLTTGEESTPAGKVNSPKSQLPPVWGIPGRQDLIAPTSQFVIDAVERSRAREPIHGYLMVKYGGIWRRLLVTSP